MHPDRQIFLIYSYSKRSVIKRSQHDFPIIAASGDVAIIHHVATRQITPIPAASSLLVRISFQCSSDSWTKSDDPGFS